MYGDAFGPTLVQPEEPFVIVERLKNKSGVEIVGLANNGNFYPLVGDDKFKEMILFPDTVDVLTNGLEKDAMAVLGKIYEMMKMVL